MKQPWIRSAGYDLFWILSPGILPAFLVVLFPSLFSNNGLSDVSWIMLILLVDVSHVYSTIYRTYFNKVFLSAFPVLFKITPLVCWILGVMLYSVGAMVFWRCLAYLAVFHFIRQQYGFYRIYSRNRIMPRWIKYAQIIAIYAVTLLPVLIWHAQGPKNFNWFIEGDFLYFESMIAASALQVIFFLVLAVYIISELYLIYRKYPLNIPSNLLLLGSAVSWYIGIVVYNGDLVFTFLNVLAHGIPYMALIWTTEKARSAQSHIGIVRYVFRSYGILLFVFIVAGFAYLEEGLWDALVWREHGAVFRELYFIPPVTQDIWLRFLVPLLALPQAVHYVLDGFIWRRSAAVH